MTGIQSITTTDTGSVVNPVTPRQWEPWVSAGRTRNYLLRDTLVDWLDLYGEAKGFKKDPVDPRTDFTPFIFDKGQRFEMGVLAQLTQRYPITTIATDHTHSRSLSHAEQTLAAMQRGVPVIYQGVLRNPNTKTFGMPDMMVRSDVLNQLFPRTMTRKVARTNAPALGNHPWHYVIVDVKFATLQLNVGGTLGNSGSAPAFKGQVFLYTEMLGRLQGYEPTRAYVLGRTWMQRDDRGTGCLDLVAPVPQADAAVRTNTRRAVQWIRKVRKQGDTWDVFKPSVPELRPNFKQKMSEWNGAKKVIDAKDLTALWFVGPKKRTMANGNGLTNIDHVETAAEVGVYGPVTGRVLQALIDVNAPNYTGPVVCPAKVTANEARWRPRGKVEFWVDFETVSNLDEDFTQLPGVGGQPLIAIVGCGHMEQGRWRYSSFVADALTPKAEARILKAWLAHMKTVKKRMGMKTEPVIFHWSHAETSSLRQAGYRHPTLMLKWSKLNFFDLWKHVARDEPVVIRGCQNFSLKTMAKALHAHGVITTTWGDGPTDGLGAMVGLWWVHKNKGSAEARTLLREIVHYCGVDCRTMENVVRYLRKNH